mgnify:CR=1 FL=1
MHHYFRNLYWLVSVSTLTALLLVLLNFGAMIMDAHFPGLQPTYTAKALPLIVWSMLLIVLVQNVVMIRTIRLIAAVSGTPTKADDVTIGKSKPAA